MDYLFPRIVEDIHKHQPEEKWAKYEAMQREYMTKVVPFLYSRGCKIWGWARHLVMNAIALFRPMIRRGTEGDMKTVLHKSCALVAQTFMLAMSEAGYDTCPVEGFDARRVRKALGLPSSVEPSLIVSCGIRDEKRPLGDRIRVPFESIYERIGK